MNKKFKIVIEGNGEGAGKSTMISKIKEKYGDLFDYRIEPDKISRAELFKPENVDIHLTDKIRLFKESRDRTNNETLDTKITICDRSAMSSYVYQGIVDGNETHREQIKKYISEESEVATEYYIVLHNDYEDLKDRRLASGREINTYDLLPDEFHKNVFIGYDEIISNYKEIFGNEYISVIDCKGKNVEETFSLLEVALDEAVKKLIFTKDIETVNKNVEYESTDYKTIKYNISGFSLDIPTYGVKLNGRSIIDVLVDIFNNIGYNVSFKTGDGPLVVNPITNIRCHMAKLKTISSNQHHNAFRQVFKVEDKLICELLLIIAQTIYETRKFDKLDLEMIQSIVTKQYFDWYATYSKNDFYTILALFKFNKGPISGIHNGVIIGDSPVRLSPVFDNGRIVSVHTNFRYNPKGILTFTRHSCSIADNGLEVSNTKKNFKNEKDAIKDYKL